MDCSVVGKNFSMDDEETWGGHVGPGLFSGYAHIATELSEPIFGRLLTQRDSALTIDLKLSKSQEGLNGLTSPEYRDLRRSEHATNKNRTISSQER